MANLVQVKTTTITGNPSSVTLDGIDTDDVYVLIGSFTISVDTGYAHFRITKDVGGTTTTQAATNYAWATKIITPYTTFEDNRFNTNRNCMYFSNSPMGASAGESHSLYYELHNFNNASKESYVIIKENIFNSTASNSYGSQGGLKYMVAEAHNGITISGDASTLTSGTLTLYKQVS